MKVGCGYIRVSTHAQEDLSPEAQKRLILEYAAKNDIVVDRFFVDNGISGRSADKRPAFNEMIATCKSAEHPYDVVLLWKFSRFSRNIDESTYYKSVLRKKCNVEVISISEPIEDSMYGKLIEMIITWSDEFYSYNLAGEVRRGMTQNAMQGGYNGTVPLGYVKAKGKDNIPVTDKVYGPVVQRIFAEVVNGKSVANIAYDLNREGFTTRSGKAFEARNICYIIRNPFYIGKIRFNNYDQQRYKNMPEALKGQYVLVDGRHEALVSVDIFNNANKELDRKSTVRSGPKQPSTTHAHWLSGTLRCGICGGPMGFQHARIDKRYGTQIPAAFVCINYTKGRCSGTSRVNVDSISKDVIDILTGIIDDDNYSTYEKRRANIIDFDDKKVVLAQLKVLDAKEARVRDAYLAGIDTIDEYRESKALLQESRRQLEEKLEQYSLDEERRNSNIIDFKGVISGVVATLNSDADIPTKEAALSEVCDKITWYKAEKRLEIGFLYKA